MVIVRIHYSGSKWHQSSSNKNKYCVTTFFKVRNTGRLQPKLKMTYGNRLLNDTFDPQFYNVLNLKFAKHIKIF